MSPSSKPIQAILLLLMTCLPPMILSASAMNEDGTAPATTSDAVDPYLWLEEVNGTAALAWVRACNAASKASIADSASFEDLRQSMLAIMDSKDRIPMVVQRGAYYYNFWRDENNPRGIWRRTTHASYLTDEPEWEILLDLDTLNRNEETNWVWKGASLLRAGGYRHALLHLSKGGADAAVVREFDLETRQFVNEGFNLPEAKTRVSWIDHDTIYVATDFGEGSMTSSGYPRIVKLWSRGQPLSEARTIHEARIEDVSLGASYDDTEGFERHFITVSPTFYTSEYFIREASEEHFRRIDIPEDSLLGIHRDWMTLTLRSPWEISGNTYPQGALIAMLWSDFQNGSRDFEILFEPDENSSLTTAMWTRNHIIINHMFDVNSLISIATPSADGWSVAPLGGIPANAKNEAWPVDDIDSDDYFLTSTGFITPLTLSRGTIGAESPIPLKASPAFFEASGLEVQQHFASSEDGTRVPYFQVSRKELAPEGNQPALLYGYGGFEISMDPWYSGTIGKAWLEKGGVFVVANIRGGGEFGPRWHQAALKQHRHRAFEDFAAVAKNLVTRGITSPPRLAAMGGSNGGLLVGNMITRYPGLFGAIVCQVPLLDMLRYHQLLAGASWMAEYGNPDDPAERDFLREYSPYHNLDPQSTYPAVLFTTSTRDDRVHPGHARKMMALMQEMGADVHYYENMEGGHGGAADNRQAAYMSALAFQFLWQTIGEIQ